MQSGGDYYDQFKSNIERVKQGLETIPSHIALSQDVNKDGDNLLIIAVRAKQAKLIEQWSQEPIEFAYQYPDPSNGHDGQEVMTIYFDPLKENGNNQSALSIAVANKDKEIVRLLLLAECKKVHKVLDHRNRLWETVAYQNRVNMDMHDWVLSNIGMTAFELALHFDLTEIVIQILSCRTSKIRISSYDLFPSPYGKYVKNQYKSEYEHKLDIESLRKAAKHSPLYAAIRHRQHEIVTLILCRIDPYSDLKKENWEGLKSSAKYFDKKMKTIIDLFQRCNRYNQSSNFTYTDKETLKSYIRDAINFYNQYKGCYFDKSDLVEKASNFITHLDNLSIPIPPRLQLPPLYRELTAEKQQDVLQALNQELKPEIFCAATPSPSPLQFAVQQNWLDAVTVMLARSTDQAADWQQSTWDTLRQSAGYLNISMRTLLNDFAEYYRLKKSSVMDAVTQKQLGESAVTIALRYVRIIKVTYPTSQRSINLNSYRDLLFAEAIKLLQAAILLGNERAVTMLISLRMISRTQFLDTAFVTILQNAAQQAKYDILLICVTKLVQLHAEAYDHRIANNNPMQTLIESIFTRDNNYLIDIICNLIIDDQRPVQYKQALYQQVQKLMYFQENIRLASIARPDIVPYEEVALLNETSLLGEAEWTENFLEDIFTNPISVVKQQRTVLLKGIERYLNERDTVRQYTYFGKKRALALQAALTRVPYQNPIEILQKHLSKDSTLNDHSLDTCLLKQILASKYLFLVTKQTGLETIELREALRQEIIEQKQESAQEYTYKVAQLYEIDGYLPLAYAYYALAMQADHINAFNVLEEVAIAGNRDVQFIMYLYYQTQNRFNEAILWCMRAADQKHPKALVYLFETEFLAEQYLMIAKKYDKGDGVTKNIETAIHFYEKAHALNNREAALRLGELHQPNGEEKEAKADAEKAFNYYLIAAKKKDQVALGAMQKIAENISNEKLQFILAQVYLETFSDYKRALSWFKKLADENVSLAVQELSRLSNKNREYAYELATLYEKDATEDSIKKAIIYYTMALRKNHTGAKTALETQANKGNAAAQYIIGSVYHHQKGELIQAINWCLKAVANNHPQAKVYLEQTKFNAEQYVIIAKRFEQGEGVAKDMKTAKDFYLKAFALHDRYSALRLGQLCQPILEVKEDEQPEELDKIQKQAKEAFHYYVVAAKQGDDSALRSLESIIRIVTDDVLQYQLGQAYVEGFAQHLPALIWLKKSADRNNLDAIRMLGTIAIAKSENAYCLADLYEQDKDILDPLSKACHYLALGIQQDADKIRAEKEEKKLERILGAAELRVKDLIDMGKKYYTGSYPIKKDDKKAKLCLEKACLKGAPIAYYALGELYENVEKNYLQAVQYYQIAFNKGYNLANTKLQSLFFSHVISTQDLITLAFYYQKGSAEIPVDFMRAVMLLQRASDRGDKLAASYLGDFYQVEHKGVLQNNELAFDSYLRAAQLGDRNALAPLEQLGEEVGPEYKRKLSNLFGTFFMPAKAEYWRMQANKAERFRFNI